MAIETPLRRSLLFVPASDPRKLERALQTKADALILDLEDSVAQSQKAEARANVQAFVAVQRDAATEILVRVNPLGSPQFEDDIEAVVAAGVRAIVLPKAEALDSQQYVVRKLEAAESEAGRDENDQVRILALIETAAGVAQAAAIASSSPRIDSLCFGHADFALDMGLVHADAAHGVVLHARCAIAIGARAAKIGAIDCVFLDTRDEMAFRQDAVMGAQLGFEGKLCIHPSQVRVANEVYTPSAEQIAYAGRVVAGWAEAQRAGHGVFALDGKMIDAPLVGLQERILARARQVGTVIDG